METNTENLKSKAMKNEFAIKCNTWEEACELFELAQDYGYRHGKGSEFCRERFKQFQGIIEFFKSGRFCQTHSILNPHPYSKQKAIELLSGQESPSIQWVHVNNRDTIIPETIMEFTFTDDKVIKTDHKGIAKELYSIAEGE